MTFSVRIAVRGYELDSQGRINSAVYHQYGDHARWECLRAAGISVDNMLGAGIGPRSARPGGSTSKGPAGTGRPRAPGCTGSP
ncbi:hypothetical protein AB0H88_06430 [Nonomuraea sp. NPDC050680]|uniref:acyl-CoA thioesterase n=1 Tax=Nonomuraea sp. NPDC050680 TaxID=3154630 RepID=UPI00340BC99D